MKFTYCFIAGMIIGAYIATLSQMKEFDAVGIRYIKKCSIDTHNCHSNWYEIVWKEAK